MRPIRRQAGSHKDRAEFKSTAEPVGAGLPAMGCNAAPNRYCYQSRNNQLRQFVFFSYNFPYILPAAS